ncbi:MAG: hypothetical protein ACTTKL_04865 [Treponema sp.]
MTKVLREAGVMNAMLISGDSAEAEAAFNALLDKIEKQKLLERIKSYKIENAVRNVSGDAVKIEETAENAFKESAQYGFLPIKSDGTKESSVENAMRGGRGKKVVLWDFGAKANIRRELLKRGVEVILKIRTALCFQTAPATRRKIPELSRNLKRL